MSQPDRLALARACVQEQVAGDVPIVAGILMGSTARGDALPTSDVDIRLLVERLPRQEHSPPTLSGWRQGLFVDMEYLEGSALADPAKVLGDPYLAGSVRDAVALYDPHRTFSRAQDQVRQEFMASRWVRARLGTLWPPIARNTREFAAAAQEGDPATASRALIFALWTACDALLVWRGISPSWVRGLQKLGQALPDERDAILRLEGISGVTPDEARHLMPLWVRARGASPGMVMQAVERELDWMMGHDLHREALHGLWAGFGLALKEKLGSGETAQRQEACSLACDWLERVGWGETDLAVKAGELEQYVESLHSSLDIGSLESPAV